MRPPRRPRPAAALFLLALLSLACGGEGSNVSPAAPEPAPQHDASAADAPPRPRAPLPEGEELARLPPDGGPEFNRLVFEASPYLRQHARNPVDWYPWGEEAFARARAEDKPIFLSIGYATCHWCHVMEHESFEDEQVAALLNRHFVCIKVDREERPDVDHVYMAVTQAFTGRGGWPNTIVMDAERKPFFAATYIPRTGRGGRRGMLELLPFLAELWREERPALLADAERVCERVASFQAGAPGDLPGTAEIERVERELAARYDGRNGGFGTAPKFPMPHQLVLLLHAWRRSGNPETLAQVEHTLRSLRRGGIYDQIGFGFHRYSTDARWLVPHFEKMLYDQALATMAYVAAWQVTGEEIFRRTAEEVLAYVLRDMTAPEGGFYSAEDADSEGEEGRFYLWTPAQVRAALPDPAESELVLRVLDIGEGGNYHDEATGAATGRSIPHLARPLAEWAALLDLEEPLLRERLEAARAKLFAVRERRVHPLKDDKILSDWNGLMIAALARAAAAFDQPRYARAAGRAADFCLRELRDEDGRLLKRWRGGRAGLPGLLEDHAFLAWGLLELYEATFDEGRLAAAKDLADAMIERFHDQTGGGFFLAPADGEALFLRPKEFIDGALPSGNSVAALVLLKLARLTADEGYEDLALETLRANAGQVRRSPSAFPQLLQAADFAAGPSFELVLAGRRGSADLAAMLRAVRRPFVPNKVVVLRPDEAPEAIVALAPYTADQTSKDGRATAYVCQDFTCQAPTTDPAEVRSALLSSAGDE